MLRERGLTFLGYMALSSREFIQPRIGYSEVVGLSPLREEIPCSSANAQVVRPCGEFMEPDHLSHLLFFVHI